MNHLVTRRRFLESSAGLLAGAAGFGCAPGAGPPDGPRAPSMREGSAARPDPSALATVSVASTGVGKGIVDVEGITHHHQPEIRNARPRPNSSGQPSTTWGAYPWEWA